MIHLATFAFAQTGFVLLLMAMVRHQQDWLHRKLPPRQSLLLRISGLVALALSFAIAGFGFDWAYGAVAWCGWLSFAAALTMTAQTNRERILARLRPGLRPGPRQ